MNLKQSMFEKIKKNSIEVNVGTDENPEYIYLKNSWGGWHTIYPPVNLDSIDKATDERGITNWKKVKWNYLNLIFGGKGNAIMYAIVGILILLLYFGVSQVFSSYTQIISNPQVMECIKAAGISLG